MRLPTSELKTLSVLTFNFFSSHTITISTTFTSFSKDKESLNRMREAEIKHCRLAMLGKFKSNEIFFFKSVKSSFLIKQSAVWRFY